MTPALLLSLFLADPTPEQRELLKTFKEEFVAVSPTGGKVQPFLAEIRAASGELDFCRHFEAVVMGAPDADAILTRRRDALRAAAGARRAPGEA